MKKIFAILFTLSLTVAVTGCQNTGKNFFGIVKGVMVQDDYEEAGYRVGKAAYMGYVIMKGDPKYDKYTKKAEEIYLALDNAESFDTTSVNQVALEILQAALTARYGYVKATLITDGVRIGGVIADRIIMKDVSAADATLYAKGLKRGIDDARAETPQEFLDEAAAKAAEKQAKLEAKKSFKYITCTEGECDYDFSKMRDTSKQLALAKELVKEGWVDYTEQKTDEVQITKAENIDHFIERTTNMKKLKIKTLKVWIGKIKVSSVTHKIVTIQFLHENFDGEILETNCVACEADLELIALEDEE